MASSWQDKRADLKKPNELLPEGFEEADLHGGIPDPRVGAGLLPNLPHSEERRELIKQLASRLSREDHQRLAWLAAVALEGLAAWHSAFQSLDEEKRGKLFEAKQMHWTAMATLRATFSQLEQDPSFRASLNASARKDRALQSTAKAGARRLWRERYEGKLPNLRTVSQFADEVMRRWPILKSHKNVCAWSAEWSKEAREQLNPAN